MQVQQITAWRSVYGSEMGEPMLPQLPGGFDETIPTMTIAQYKQLAFKKPFIPVKRFQVMLPARAVSPAGSAVSSMHMGVSAADCSQQSRAPTREGSPSPSVMDRQ